VLFLVAFAWVLLITSFSTTHFSANNTAIIIEPWLSKVFPSLSLTTIHFIHVMIRKSAHFSEFGVLAILVFGIWATRVPKWKLQWLAYTLVIVVSLALLDEYHQAFVRSRNASLGDSFVDTFGAITSLLLIWLVKRDKFKT